MNDWAEKAAIEAANQDRLRELNLEKNSRDAQLKTTIGGKLFAELYDWISTQTKKFNAIRKKEEFTVNKTVVPGLSGSANDQLRVNIPNHRALIIEYCSVSHFLSYECGGVGRKEFKLELDEKGESGVFKTADHEPVKIEDLGAEMLDGLLRSQF
ncbi:MAG: hypothetical protein WBV69_08455 [Candidatus Sulfotelmatobacter sp.]